MTGKVQPDPAVAHAEIADAQVIQPFGQLWVDDVQHFRGALGRIPRIEASIRNHEPDAHACGEQETG